MAGCGTITRNVSLVDLQGQLAADSSQASEGGLSHTWSYIGSCAEMHYFRRQLMAFGRNGFRDGVYTLPRSSLQIPQGEFERPSPDDSTMWKSAFTRIDPETLIPHFCIQYGIAMQPLDVYKSDEGIEATGPRQPVRCAQQRRSPAPHADVLFDRKAHLTGCL